MTDLQATLDAIDQVAVHQCGYCSRPLSEGSESLDYCGPRCQQAWVSERQQIVELVGYDEPSDLPEHVYNLVELDSPETTPALPDWQGPWFGIGHLSIDGSGSPPPVRDLTLRLTFDTSRFEAATERMSASIRALGAWMREYQSQIDGAHLGSLLGQVVRRATTGRVIIDEIHDWHPIGLINTMRVTAPEAPPLSPCEGGFGSDFDFVWRPVPGLYGDPRPAVMPGLPERDWQALVDAGRPHTGPVRRVRAPRQLGRTR